MIQVHASSVKQSVKRIVAKLLGRQGLPPLVQDIAADRLAPRVLTQAEQRERIHQHLHQVGKSLRAAARPRVFLAVHHVNWEQQGLVESWQGIADYVHYDWGERYDQYAKNWQDTKQRFNEELYQNVVSEHRRRPIELFFSYLSGRWVYPETIARIGQLGIITVNISLDDKLYFWGYRERGALSGCAEIAPAFDLCITTQSAVDTAKYHAVGANPLFLPPAGNQQLFQRTRDASEREVSFVGQCYGLRPRVIAQLQQRGIEVATYGKGWGDASEISFASMLDVYSRSLINIGFGYIADTEDVGLKGRDFEVPFMGNLYLTSYCDELAQCYVIGQEIDCYATIDELAQKIHYYRAHPEQARAIGEAGRQRCLREHTWEQRFQTVLALLGGDARPDGADHGK